jgi:hypothetical protein
MSHIAPSHGSLTLSTRVALPLVIPNSSVFYPNLTHLTLPPPQDSIGGDAKMLMIVCISPGNKYVSESVQSLRFGVGARNVQKGQAIKKRIGTKGDAAA